jgi:hypothetical protein
MFFEVAVFAEEGVLYGAVVFLLLCGEGGGGGGASAFGLLAGAGDVEFLFGVVEGRVAGRGAAEGFETEAVLGRQLFRGGVEGFVGAAVAGQLRLSNILHGL